jgi:hypothetical protein
MKSTKRQTSGSSETGAPSATEQASVDLHRLREMRRVLGDPWVRVEVPPTTVPKEPETPAAERNRRSGRSKR